MEHIDKKIKINESPSPFDSLPNVIICLIGEQMEMNELIKFSALNKSIRNAINKNSTFWKNRFFEMRNQLIQSDKFLQLKTEKEEMILPCNINYSESQGICLRFRNPGLINMEDLMKMDQQKVKKKEIISFI
jgi:hypothetical protein